jgi:putative nucleotidyltransferase with HDIG domain
MTGREHAAKAPPRLIVNTLVATFGAIFFVLGSVFVILTMDTQNRVTRAVADNLDAGQRTFAALERRRQEEGVLQAETLVENPTLKAALDTYHAERKVQAFAPELVATIQREADKLTRRLRADAIVIVDPAGTVVASAGPRRLAWPPGRAVVEPADVLAPTPIDLTIQRPSDTFRVVSVPLTVGDTPIGALLLATALDDAYARQLSALSRAQTAIVFRQRVIASTLDPVIREAFDHTLRAGTIAEEEGVVTLEGQPYAVRRLFEMQSAAIYAVDSIEASAHRATSDALEALGFIGLGGLVLGGLASLWLARSISQPINRLSQELRLMAGERAFPHRIPRSGSSRELDVLTDTFNELMGSLASAEAQTEMAYLGAIKALAVALDARDTYTAGHSERVSALSVMIGRQMGLDAEQLDILRLGALLHDIGKIGIRDRVLSKEGPLTPEEFEIIKTHPAVGAHILRQIPFLSAHVPIVELHHERPDGRGYPNGLLGHATPLLARIVHVADAFDAMTTARAYRPAQGAGYALSELWRYAGSQFDTEAVEAFVAAWSAVSVNDARSDVAAIVAGVRGPAAPPPSGQPALDIEIPADDSKVH